MAASTKNETKKPAAAKAAKAAPAKKAAPAAKAAAAPVKAAPKKAPAKKKGTGAAVVVGVGPDQRRHYIEVAAYYIAERNGFAPGSELEHWATAEAEIDRLLAEGLLNG